MGNDSTETFECDVCNMQCAALKGLIAHKKFHENSKSKTCQICEKTFRDHYTLQRHLKKSNGHGSNSGLDQQKELLHFNSTVEFKKWKVKMETETKAEYVQHKGSRKNINGTTVTYLYCHRDGFFSPKGKHIRNIKTLGSNKINSHCGSKIIVRERGSIDVEFFSSHSGHTMDRARLSKERTGLDDIAKEVAEHDTTDTMEIYQVIMGEYSNDLANLQSYATEELIEELSVPAQITLEVQNTEVDNEVKEILNLLDINEKINIFRN